MAFFTGAITAHQPLAVALGADLGIWGAINLPEGYGNDSPGAKRIHCPLCGGKPRTKVYGNTLFLGIKKLLQVLTIVSKPAMDTVSMLTQKLIAENATKAMNQEVFQQKTDSYTEQYNTLQERKSKLDGRKVTIRFEVDILECFMFEIQAMPELPMEFSEHLWNAMIDHVKVYHDGRVVFNFKNGGEITKNI